MNPTGPGGRLVRRFAAGAILLLGGLNLVSAATVAPVRRSGVFGVDYAVAAIIGARYVLLAAGIVANRDRQGTMAWQAGRLVDRARGGGRLAAGAPCP